MKVKINTIEFQSVLFRQLALKRLRIISKLILWRLPWVAMDVFFSLLSEPQIVMKQEPGKKPLERHEWDRHYHHSPKIF